MVDEDQKNLGIIKSTGNHPDAEVIKTFKKKNWISPHKTSSYKVFKGIKFSTVLTKEETDITAELLSSGDWKNAAFKKYNFEASGQPLQCGHLHPLLKVRDEFKQIFFELG